jgi:hypothetical protein
MTQSSIPQRFKAKPEEPATETTRRAMREFEAATIAVANLAEAMTEDWEKNALDDELWECMRVLVDRRRTAQTAFLQAFAAEAR